MNPQLNPSYNPSINPNMASSINSQFGMNLPTINPYISYPGVPSMNLPFGQLKNVSRNVSPMNIPYNPYTNPHGVSSLYSHPYLGSYPQGMIGGYIQTPPPSFSHMMGL